MKAGGARRNPDRPTVYRITVEGRLDESWLEWMDDMRMTVASTDDGPPITTLTGTLPDQAALQGILSRIGMLNLRLISVTEAGQNPDPDS